MLAGVRNNRSYNCKIGSDRIHHRRFARTRSSTRQIATSKVALVIIKEKKIQCTWTAEYAIARGWTDRIPNNAATSDLVRLSPEVLDRLYKGSWWNVSSSGRVSPAELGDVKMCLNVLDLTFECQYTLKVTEALKLTRTSKVPLKSPLVGSSRLYLPSWYMNVGQECAVTWKLWS